MKDLVIILIEKYLIKKVITGKHIAIAILFLPVASEAQHTTQHTNMLWAGYYNTIHFNKKWLLASDVQLRTRDWADKWSQFLVRSGLAYSFNKDFSAAGGFALFKNAQYAGKLLLKNEWRPWQELSYKIMLRKINLLQKFRTEERFLQEVANNKKISSYQYIFRLRYRFEWQFSLPDNNIKLLIGNEIMLNPGYINNTLFFDQNRAAAGVLFKLNKTTNLQCQYMKIFQWHSNTSVLDDQNIFRINILQQFISPKNKS